MNEKLPIKSGPSHSVLIGQLLSQKKPKPTVITVPSINISSDEPAPIDISESDSQIILYAKGHFERGNVLEDVRKLVAARAWMDTVDDHAIMAVLLIIAEQLGVEKQIASQKFMDYVVFGRSFGVKWDQSPIERYVQAMLDIFHGVLVWDSKNLRKLVDLKEPNFTLLNKRSR